MSSPEATYDLLILGASMAGVEVVYQLRRHRASRELRIGVVDAQEVHGYIPLCQERISERVRDHEGRLHTAGYVEAAPNTEMIVGTVRGMDPRARAVFLEDGRELRAAQIVVCLGSVISPPRDRIPGIERAHALKFDVDVANLRRLLHELRAPTGPEQPRVVVVGGGITGVELAGELAWMAGRANDLQRPFEVTLVHGGPRLLPALCPRAGALATRHLEAQGVDLRVRARIVEVSAEGAIIEDHVPAVPERLDMPADLVLWAGGIQPAPVLRTLGMALRDGWLAVDPHLRGHAGDGATLEGVYVAGDAACVVEGDRAWPTMKRAIECLWQAKVVARNVLAGVHGGRLAAHTLREDFPHGVSIGARSLVVSGPVVLDRPRINTWFRRFLMRQYFARYRAR